VPAGEGGGREAATQVLNSLIDARLLTSYELPAEDHEGPPQQRIEIIHGPGEEVPAGRDLDFVVSIGVIQFIRDPLPTLKAAREALRPGGKLVIWVYGKEGNRLYVALVTALRAVTTRLPHFALAALCGVLTLLVDAYIFACRWLPLPMHAYARTVLSPLSWEKRKLTIYDQLNPTYARYYLGPEVKALLERAGLPLAAHPPAEGEAWRRLGPPGHPERAARQRQDRPRRCPALRRAVRRQGHLPPRPHRLEQPRQGDLRRR